MMSWLSDAWAFYKGNLIVLTPLLAPLGSVLVGLGTVLVGGLVAWAALRQARTATQVARIANRQAEIAAARHEEQTRADRQRRITDTFSKAVEQLGSDKMEMLRVGGIYTLERLAREALASQDGTKNATTGESDLYWTVMETLTAFIRERARWKEPEPSEPGRIAQSDLWQTGIRSGDAAPRPTPTTDIAAVLAVICRRPDAGREREKQRDWRFDLNTTDLRGASLIEARLDGASLIEAHLDGANLSGAHLDGANLSEANLKGAILDGANLRGASLDGAHLEDAILIEARLDGAILGGAHLEDAILDGAHLEGASLSGAHLEGASLSGAIGDAKTCLPEGVARPTDWPAYAPD